MGCTLDLRRDAVRAAILALAVACNQAPDTRSWRSSPSDDGCHELQPPDPDPVEIDGYLYCGVDKALRMDPIDDPIYAPCSEVDPNSKEPVMAVFDGERARAYQTALLPGRELVHTRWDGADLLVAYCPVIEGGVVFHREIGGVSRRFNLAGMWGSANTVTPRDELATGDYTVYSSWDGHALTGPGRPDQLEKFAALVDYVELGEFVSRYGDLASCRVWSGEEELGVDCVEACDNRSALCNGGGDGELCRAACESRPRSWSDCLRLAETCEGAQGC